ncbi:hypothetical protein B4073_3424 [Bacillus subtilis]|nr:hypothetical protein B4068_3517 [Bacillus subtilis]KIN50467.1 hypothetical protein B4073_3424 [Bacillus subtilis]
MKRYLPGLYSKIEITAACSQNELLLFNPRGMLHQGIS